MIFTDSIKQLFTIKHFPFSLYISFGVLLSQLAQIHVYYKIGVRDLQTWFSAFHLAEKPQPMILTIQLCIVMAICLFLLLQIFFSKSQAIEADKFLKWGILITIIICVISNLILSSIMRIPYEALFCFVSFFALLLQNQFIGAVSDQVDIIGKSYKELWDMLKMLIPVCLGLPIVMGGVGFIAAFYKEAQEVINLQLYRHVYMAIYFELGAISLLIYPIFKRLLIYRAKLM